MKPIFKEQFFLSAGETNAEHEMALPLLVSKLIDIATAHANSLGIGNPSMEHMNAGWVLSRLVVEMNQYPKVNENYILSTWIEDFNRKFSIRNFKIESPTGKIYGYARSVWLVMDTVNHTNVGLGHFNMPAELISGIEVPVEPMRRHIPVLPEESVSQGVSHYIAANHPPFQYRFQYCDLDSYRHVNTVRYVAMLLNRFTLEEHDKTLVKRLELSFLHEAKYGMNTILYRGDDNNDELKSSFMLFDSADNTSILSARIEREKREETF